MDANHHFMLVLELGELGGDNAKDNILVPRKVGERLKATGTRGVVLEVVCVDVEVLNGVSKKKF